MSIATHERIGQNIVTIICYVLYWKTKSYTDPINNKGIKTCTINTLTSPISVIGDELLIIFEMYFQNGWQIELIVMCFALILYLFYVCSPPFNYIEFTQSSIT